MPGKVYCFNWCNERIHQLKVNGLSAGSINGWAMGGDTIYTPVSKAIARVRYGDGQERPAFPGDMPTSLRIEWEPFTAEASIDLSRMDNVSFDDDLLLHIAVNQLTLTNTRGRVLVTTPLRPR